MALQFGQIEVGGRAAAPQDAKVMKEIEAEVEQRARNGPTALGKVRLDHVPSPWPYKDHDRVRSQFAGPGIAVSMAKGPAVGVPQVLLAFNAVAPDGRVGILEVRHEHAGA